MTQNHFFYAAWSALIVIFTGVSSLSAEGKSLFAGNFVDLNGGWAQRDILVNYPGQGQGQGQGRGAICGIELKASTLILHPRVWQNLASRLIVSEMSDDLAPQVLNPQIRNGYSPSLFYFFTNLNAEYGTISIRSGDGSSLQSVFDDILGGGISGGGISTVRTNRKIRNIRVIAVAARCDDQSEAR